MRFMSHPRALGWLINLILHHKDWSKTQVLGKVFQYSKSKFLLGHEGAEYAVHLLFSTLFLWWGAA